MRVVGILNMMSDWEIKVWYKNAAKITDSTSEVTTLVSNLISVKELDTKSQEEVITELYRQLWLMTIICRLLDIPLNWFMPTKPLDQFL